MIDWDLTAEQVSIQDMARAFARQEIAPLSREIDINDLGFPEPLLAKMREAGFFAMGISADTRLSGTLRNVCSSEMVARVTRTAMLLHGGLGYALETDANRYWRDGMLMSIGEGTSDIQREIISKALLNAK
ncbi:acyl-CoA dehydrogenase family protein [Acidocella sp.]|uniref:acyl-CoA dehydrogenase family protein n=1 Tax=Acidocella sp. TaxID=50710 RepID=UPI00260F4A00|nr:acyl-CoA dehydrogenase family protein [Acidocella sp.]